MIKRRKMKRKGRKAQQRTATKRKMMKNTKDEDVNHERKLKENKK